MIMISNNDSNNDDNNNRNDMNIRIHNSNDTKHNGHINSYSYVYV